MNWTVVQRILGLLLMMFSLTMLPPIIISIVFDEPSWLPFVKGFGITLLAGFICWLPVHKSRKDLKTTRLPLPCGSLLLMGGDTQRHWKHGIAKIRQPCGPRINLTFRKVFPPNGTGKIS